MLTSCTGNATLRCRSVQSKPHLLVGSKLGRAGSSSSNSSAGRHLHTQLHAYTLKMASGQSLSLDKASASVGSAGSAEVKISGPQVEAVHALLEAKGKQMFVKALVGESMLDKSYSYVDGQELRPRVSYLLASGCQLAFGPSSADNVMTIEYEQPTGANPMMEMLMKGMLASASPETKQAMQ